MNITIHCPVCKSAVSQILRGLVRLRLVEEQRELVLRCECGHVFHRTVIVEARMDSCHRSPFLVARIVH